MKLQIVKAGINGEGIGFYKRKPVFVEGCFPGETIDCDIIDEGRHCRGKLKKIIQRSPYRISSPCPHSFKCGGCTLIDLEYEEQLRIKKQLLEGALYKYAEYEEEINDIVPSPKQFSYRNKCNLPVIEHNGKLVNALYKQGSNHPAVIDECIVHDEKVEKIRKQILNVLNHHHLKAYYHKEKSGIRQLVIRGFEDEYQAVIISGNDDLGNMIDDLKKIRDLTSVYQGINIHKNPVNMMPEHLKLLYGKKKIEMKTGDYRLCLSPQAFFQLNHDQASRIYRDVSEMIDERKKLIVEAYCGIGAISLYLHDKAQRLIGIEIIERAVKDAKDNARINRYDHMEFICDDASKALRKITKNEKIDVLVVDPPRTGLDDELLTTLLKTKIDQIIYISCNPSTLGKDLSILQKKYHIASIQGYDMFPNTPHVETVVLLSKGNISSKKVHVDFSLEDMDMSGIKTGATYDEIKAYVKKNYALTVSSLNIAQIKEKYGIKERENFNHSKKQDPKQPKCTEEKEEAILDALKYYNMV